MLESTFSTIIQHWDTFDESIRGRARMTLQFLIDNRKGLLQRSIVRLPSLSKFPELIDVENQLKKLRTQLDVGETFGIFAQRLCHENSGVVAQALIELKTFLRANQSFLQSSAVSEQPDKVVGQLIRSILDNCVKFSESDETLTQLSAECIGLIGCLDSNRVETVREYREMVVVSNFEDILETTDFVLCILEKVIVPVFLSTTDTGIQGFFSFVIQELLFKFNFREACMNQSGYEAVHGKWQALSPALQDTLTPFLNSKFMLQDMNMPDMKYPLFRPEQAGPRGLYNNWVKSFVLDLLRKHSNLATQLMFPILCRTIRIRTISPANFLLPYVVLHAIVAGTDQQRNEIGSEILRVLEYEVPADSLIRREDLKLCVEACISFNSFGFLLTVKGCLSHSRVSCSLDTGKANPG
jgi:serine/threonine-protein kinase ATR